MGLNIVYCGLAVCGLSLLLALFFAIKKLRYDASRYAVCDEENLSVSVPGTDEILPLTQAPVAVKVDKDGIDYEIDIDKLAKNKKSRNKKKKSGLPAATQENTDVNAETGKDSAGASVSAENLPGDEELADMDLLLNANVDKPCEEEIIANNSDETVSPDAEVPIEMTSATDESGNTEIADAVVQDSQLDKSEDILSAVTADNAEGIEYILTEETGNCVEGVARND